MTNKIDALWNSLDKQNQSSVQRIKPLWSIKLDNDEEVLKWFEDCMASQRNLMEDHLQRYIQNVKFYKGDQLEEDPKTPRDIEPGKARKRTVRKVVVNFCYEYVDLWVNRYSQYKPQILCSPTKDVYTNRVKAEMAQEVVGSAFEKEGMEDKFQKLQAESFIGGEAYIVTDWNPNKGPTDPVYQAEMDKKIAKDPEMSTQRRLKVVTKENDEIYLESPLRVGDVDYKIYPFVRVLCPDVLDLDTSDWQIFVDVEDEEVLLARYPEKYKKKEDQKIWYIGAPDGKVEVFKLVHKSTDQLESGRRIIVAGGSVLENTVHPYKHKELIGTRLTDIEVPNEARSRSFLENIIPLQVLYNNLTSLIYRNIALGAHPKWLVPAGSTKISGLGNDMTVVEYSGVSAPTLATFSTVPADVFNFRENIRKEAERQAQVQSTSQGAPPPNVRSGLQMAQLEEQQTKAITYKITKRNKAIERVARQTLSIMADYYDKSDDRFIKIVGKDKEPILKSLDPAMLDGEFEIRVYNAAALPEGRFAKLGLLTDLRNTFGPEVVPNEVAIDAFQIEKPEKILKFATASVERAEYDIQLMRQGQTPPEPKPYEDLKSKWRIYVTAMRQVSFDLSPENVKELFRLQVQATEYLIDKRAEIDPVYAQAVLPLKIEGFPVFLKPTPAPNPAMSPVPAEGGKPPAMPPPQPEMA
jgi:hypothetical protein